ncbi:MAG: CehA/McbA family metallohydrolase [Planctomycetota bacterium]
MNRSRRLAVLTWSLLLTSVVHAADLTPIAGVEKQPFVAQVQRVVEAFQFIGSPLSLDERSALKAAYELKPEAAVKKIQEILAPRVLIAVNVNPESRVKASRGPARAELMQQGWRAFLVRVHNEAGVTAKLVAESPNAAPLHRRSTGSKEPKRTVKPSDVANRWADVKTFDKRPLNQTLSGLLLEYRILEVYSRDVGKREAKISFNVGQGTQDLGFRSDVNILFNCVPAVEVVMDVKDFDGSNTTAWFEIRDQRGRIYPSRSRRLAPDFFFHDQIYRSTGQSVSLPPGSYSVTYGRGPEYLRGQKTVEVPKGQRSYKASFGLNRWVHPKTMKWFSGDHHVHAAGCQHYESPSEGVTPQDMMLHILGEDLNVGCVLTWGPCWYFQKQFFDGKVSALSQKSYAMRYDVEVSGFPSDHTGHLCLLRLKEDDYPGTKRTEDWPSWGMPILKWGKEQGGVVGYSHSGWGLAVNTAKLPNYEIPPFDGIGANEYIAAVTHGVVDFISTVDTPYVWELNIWYHTLNCGYRARISGETDFPCIYGERVGLGRIYAKLDGPLNFDSYADAIRDGRSYVGDGRSHLIDFRVGDVSVGEGKSELKLDAASDVKVRARVAALLDQKPNPSIRDRSYHHQPYWHIERARVGNSRTVPLELVVNGEAVKRVDFVADGTMRDVEFDVRISRSSWVALRILPSSHTNPVFVVVDGKPIRASKKSARWCIDSVDRCWSQKERRIRARERDDARKAYDFARAAYRRILEESTE